MTSCLISESLLLSLINIYNSNAATLPVTTCRRKLHVFFKAKCHIHCSTVHFLKSLTCVKLFMFLSWPIFMCMCVSVSPYVSQSIQTTITKYHILSNLHKTEICHSYGGWNSKIRVPVWLASGEGPLPGFRLLLLTMSYMVEGKRGDFRPLL